MKRISEIFSLFVILNFLIRILNSGCGIVGGIWLAFLGKWELIIMGGIFIYFSPLILSILMMPNIPIALAALHFWGKEKCFGYLAGIISQLYSSILIVVICIVSFYVCSSFYKGNLNFGYIPYLLWSWVIALGPWHFLSSKEQDNEFSAITTFFASVFYLLFLTGIFIYPPFGILLGIIFSFVLLIILPIFLMYYARKMELEEYN